MNTNQIHGKATRIKLFSFAKPHMRAFHMTWLAFFLCFFGWFGLAPLLPIIREDLGLTASQVYNTLIASVGLTIAARIGIGWVIDKIGPRRTYTALLLLGALPVMLVGLSQNYETFLLFRLAIGVIGASFVITQFHTTLMFAPNVVGTANATTAGWGNLGGGATNLAMPQIMYGLIGLFALFPFLPEIDDFIGWRVAMVVPGIAMLITGIAYWKQTQDAPEGDFKELRARGIVTAASSKGAFKAAMRDPRVWILFLVYAGCFGIELFMNGILSIYFVDNFGLSVGLAGAAAGLFGLMNLFARSVGGILSDRFGIRGGLRARVVFLSAVLAVEGVALIAFSRIDAILLALPMLIVFSAFVQMAEGATYAVVPFVNKKAVGAVAGVVGAGGNFGAVMANLLLRSQAFDQADTFMFAGIAVACIAPLALFVRFSRAQEEEEAANIRAALAPERGEPVAAGSAGAGG